MTEITDLVSHSREVATDWLLATGDHKVPVVHHRENDGTVTASMMPVLGTELKPIQIHIRVGNTLQQLVRDGVKEFTLSYEGIWVSTHQRVLVVVHYTPDREITWVAPIKPPENGKLEVGTWEALEIQEGAIHGIYQKALQHQWN